MERRGLLRSRLRITGAGRQSRLPSATRDDLRRLALWLTVEEPDLRGLIDQAIDTVVSVSKAEFWKEARNSAECHEEAPFAVLEKGDGPPTIVNGVVDLAYRLPNGWQIVDYKTDLGADQAELEARYAKQLTAYEKAWSLLNKEAVTTRLFLARPGSVTPPN